MECSLCSKIRDAIFGGLDGFTPCPGCGRLLRKTLLATLLGLTVLSGQGEGEHSPESNATPMQIREAITATASSSGGAGMFVMSLEGVVLKSPNRPL
jgi:hypothetical protein